MPKLCIGRQLSIDTNDHFGSKPLSSGYEYERPDPARPKKEAAKSVTLALSLVGVIGLHLAGAP